MQFPFAVTAERFEDIPTALAGLVDTVVSAPPLRDRSEDVLPLADHIAKRARGRHVEFSPSASRALKNYDWAGNVDELSRVVSHATSRADLVDVGCLPPEVRAGNTKIAEYTSTSHETATDDGRGRRLLRGRNANILPAVVAA